MSRRKDSRRVHFVSARQIVMKWLSLPTGREMINSRPVKMGKNACIKRRRLPLSLAAISAFSNFCCRALSIKGQSFARVASCEPYVDINFTLAQF